MHANFGKFFKNHRAKLYIVGKKNDWIPFTNLKMSPQNAKITKNRITYPEKFKNRRVQY